MARRADLDRFGLFDEEMILGSEDLELSWRLRCFGRRLLIAKDVFVHHAGGKSFASLPSQAVQNMLTQSSQALVRKLHRCYPKGAQVTALELWDVDFLPCESDSPFALPKM